MKTLLSATILAIAYSLALSNDQNGTLNRDDRSKDSAASFTERVAGSKVFKEPLLWVGNVAPTEQESETLWTLCATATTNNLASGIEKFEEFISHHPGSPWTPSLQANLAYYYRSSGRYTPALELWQAAWDTTRQYKSGSGKRVADFTLVHWSQLLGSLGRLETLESLFATTTERKMEDLSWQQVWLRTISASKTMKQDPGMSYRCGSFALMHVAKAQSNSLLTVGALLDARSPITGFSMSELTEMADKHHLGLVAVRRDAGPDIVVPSVIHWRQNHYAAIVERRGDMYLVQDPTFGRPLWMTAKVINSEASGAFLVPETNCPATWSHIGKAETDNIFGKGMNSNDPPPETPPCPQDGEDECDCPPSGGEGTPDIGACGGMPVWRVDEPYISLWLDDKPMFYQTTLGKEFALKLTYHQRETRPIQTNIFSMGQNWNCNWISYMDVTDQMDDASFVNYSVQLYGARGGALNYAWNITSSEYRTHTRIVRLGNSTNLTGFTQTYPNGSAARYGLLVNVSSYPMRTLAFMTDRIDPQGRTNQHYIYNTNSNRVLLTAVVDFDGKTNTLHYDNVNYPTQITQVDNPYSNSVYMAYDTNGYLTNIVDVVGLSSSFLYTISNSTPLLTTLRTPYGDTAFNYFRPLEGLYGFSGYPFGSDDDINRAITVTQPDSGKHLFMYRDNSEYLYRNSDFVPFLPYCYCPDVPSGPPVVGLNEAYWLGNYVTCDCNNSSIYDGLNDHNMFYRNTFHWGPRQYPLLSTNDITQFNTNDYKLALMRNWLHTDPNAPGAGLSVGQTLSMQRDPSPDGVTDGQKVWYGYTGKTAYYHYEGTNSKPAWIARLLPDGTSRYSQLDYNSLGYITNLVETYSSGSSVLLRTNKYVYSTNDADLLRIIGPDGITNVAYGYNTNHQIVYSTNAIGEVTTNSFNGHGQLTGIAHPTGLVVTNIYGSDGYLATNYSYAIVGGSPVYYGTNSYTYTNGLVFTHLDERGLKTTNTWDALQRLRRVDFPDATFITNSYGRLDLVQVRDRMGFSNSFGFDSMRRLIAITNENGVITRFDQCECGALNAMTNAYGTPQQAVTRFVYDNQGNKTVLIYADGYTVTNKYNSLRQITNVIDSAGTSVTNWFNNQGLRVSASNYCGQVFAVSFDLNDRPTNVVNQNAISVSLRYDNLGRLMSGMYPDGGTEALGYTFNVSEATSYTNELNKVAYFSYDAVGRTISETNANGEVTQLNYSPAGELLNVVDGMSHATYWSYDAYGLVTNKQDAANNVVLTYKYDANQRLTNRNSIAKGNTYYGYDRVGNLTNVTYATSPAVSLSYDALNRLSNMVDAVGTTRYGYDAVGQMVSEDGPWADDTVRFTYANRVRSALILDEPNSSPWVQTYGYDGARRLTNLVSPAGSFLYGYDNARQRMVKQVSLPNGASITNSYDGNGRLLSTKLLDSGLTILNAHSYGYNAGNQRTNQVFTAGNVINYAYDNIGQLTNAAGKESGGATNRLLEQFKYSYDAAHNLSVRTNNSLVQTFSVNSLNEITTVTRNTTNALTVAGATSSRASSVTVNGSAAVLYGDASFAKDGITITNGSNTFTAIGVDSLGRSDTNTVAVYLPATNSYTYDLNGNLLSDGKRGFDYDDENQLIAITVTNEWKSEFSYDGMQRMRVRREYAWNGGWLQTNEVRYVYDGRLVIQERNRANLPVVSYTRGLDASGGRHHAGGIGGILARTDHSQVMLTHAYYHADGNGNITAINDSHQITVAKYSYDPFGRIARQSGPLADANKYRFSSKEFHDNSGLYYFGYRCYDPALQSWPNRDPLGEYAGNNLHNFAFNDPVNYGDLDGLWGVQIGGINFGWGDPTYDFDGLDWDGYWGDVGDTLVGELKGAGAELSFGLYTPCYTSDLQRQGGNVGTLLAMAGETFGGLGAAGKAAKWSGKEFSHFIPAEVLPGGRKGLLDKALTATKLNGNYVKIAEHAVTDPARYRFMPKAWKKANPLLNPIRRQLNRIPRFPLGAAAAAAGGYAASHGDEGCR